MTDQLTFDVDEPEQLVLAGMGYISGDVYRNLHTNDLATVLAVRQRRQAWLLIRVGGREREVKPAEFAQHYVPFRRMVDTVETAASSTS